MAFSKAAALAFLSLAAQSVSGQNVTDNLKYVDQLIGSANGGSWVECLRDAMLTDCPGNVFAGATMPYGMAKAVADVDSDSNQGGFTTEGGRVTGFSTMHDSGTGTI